MDSVKNLFKKNAVSEKSKLRLTVSFLVLLFLAPRVFNLGTDITNSDALRWHNRSENFLNALKTGDLKSTYQRYHPGVTIMWIGAVSSQLLFEYQQFRGEEVKTLQNADFYPTLHGFSKLMLVLVLAVCFATQIYLILKLFGKRTALLYGIIMSLEPYLIGINRWFHLSSLETFFAFTSVLFALCFMKEKKIAHLILSAVFVGLGVITKMTVLISVAFIVFLMLRYMLLRMLEFKHLALFAAVSLLTAWVLFPALWANSLYVFNKMYTALFGAVTSDARGELLTAYQKLFYYPLILSFKMSPFLLAAGVYSLYVTFKKKDSRLLPVATYFLFLLIFMTLTDQKIDRYSVALFPPLILVLADTLAKFKKPQIIFGSVLYLVVTVYGLFSYYPVNSAYISPLFSHRFVLGMGFYENSGEYFSNAALYLNSKGRDIMVYIPNNIDAFAPYYKGKYTNDYIEADYIVAGVDFDRMYFPVIPDCEVDKYFGNVFYKPVAVFACEMKKPFGPGCGAL